MEAKLRRILIILWLFAIVVSVIVVVHRHKKARERFQSLEFHGIVNKKTYLDVEKGLFIQVGGEWFELIYLTLEQYITKGDSIYKYSSSKCMMVYRDNPVNKTLRFCDGYIARVQNKNTLRKISGVEKTGKIKTTRE